MASTRVRTALSYSISQGGVAPRRFLRLEVPDAVRLGVLDAHFFHGGFPADVLLTHCFELVESLRSVASPRRVTSCAISAS
ncbi:hypothetical protein [Streptomyces lavendulae]|uniref:hypothetical protein n=1 Tax=Streptomyces lavendulae TaxID=1914 RepID=UPI0034088BCD